MNNLTNKKKALTALLLSLMLIFAMSVAAGCTFGDTDDTGEDGIPTLAVTTATPTPEGYDPGTVTPPENKFPNRPNADTRSGSAKELSEGDVAPEFSVSLLDGSTFRLSEHDDDVVLLNFWATWCGPCVREMPDLEKLYKENRAGFAMCCISVSDPLSDVKEFVNDKGLATGMIGCATASALGEYYPSDYIPYTVVVDHGIVRETIIGTHSYSDYCKIIEKYLK